MGDLLISGTTGSPGVATGRVIIIDDIRDVTKVRPGDVLVMLRSTPDWVQALKQASAVISVMGGKTSHAAIVSRELGIPCVVRADDAMEILKNGQMVTVDGTNGKVYRADGGNPLIGGKE